MDYTVKSSFRDKFTKKVYERGDTYENENADRIAFLIEKGFLEEKSKQPLEDSIKHTGGGWYELPNGEKIKGKEEALAELEKNEKNG